MSDRMIERVAWLMTPTLMAEGSAQVRESVIADVRRIFKGMREPTEAMTTEGALCGLWGPDATDGDATPTKCWRAMIDAALKETP